MEQINYTLKKLVTRYTHFNIVDLFMKTFEEYIQRMENLANNI